jgi:hypothetical protein
MIKIIEALKNLSDTDFKNLQIDVFFVEKDKDGKFPDDKKHYTRYNDFSNQKNFFVVELYSNTKVDNGVFVSYPSKNFLFTHTFLLDLTQLQIEIKDFLEANNDNRNPHNFVSSERLKIYLKNNYLKNIDLLRDYNGAKDNYKALAADIYKHIVETVSGDYNI